MASCVLYIHAGGSSWWDKSSGQWQESQVPLSQPVRVVADLTEETFVEIAVPRVFGNDRTRFVQRQLANRFPETRFRAALAPALSGGLMNRLAPPKQTLTAIEPDERLKTVLAAVTAPIVGVWGISVVLAQLGQSKALPGTLLMVLSQVATTRIVFFKDRAPVLTRLVSTGESAAEQAVEILRTVRHLENTKVLERGAQRLPALLLGTAQGLSAVLSGDRIDTVAAPGKQWAGDASAWRAGLFDLLCKGPSGQLAPMALRTSYLTQQVEKGARLGMAACLAVGLVAASGSVLSLLGDSKIQSQLRVSAGQLTGQIGEVEIAIESFGVSPELLRKVLVLDSDEIATAPELRSQLSDLARVVGSVPGARVTQLQWTLMAPTDVACPLEAGATPAALQEPVAEPSRKVELRMALNLAAEIGPRLQLQQASQISAQLKALPGAKVVSDPAKALREGGIGSGAVGQADTQRSLTWCVVLPGVVRSASTEEPAQ